MECRPRRHPRQSLDHGRTGIRGLEGKGAEVTGGQQPRWQPLSRLPLVGSSIDEGLADAERQYALLLEAKHGPHVLDDHTVARTLQVYGDTRDDLWVFE